MSIALMSAAWSLDLPTSPKMCLLAMCDWANDQGGSLFPSVAQLAIRMSCSDRTAQRVLHGLIDAGWLSVVGNVNGGRPGMSRQYRISVGHLYAMQAAAKSETGDKLTPVSEAEESDTGDKLSPVKTDPETGDICDKTGDICDMGRVTNEAGRVTSATGRVTNQVETGDTHVTLSVIEPSIEPRKKKEERVRATPIEKPDDVDLQTWTDWLGLRKAKAAPVSLTVLAEARRQAGMAGLSLTQFLTIWCLRGSTGLQASWLRPDERGAATPAPLTFRERDEAAASRRVDEFMGRSSPPEVIGMVFDVSARQPALPPVIGAPL